MHNASAGMVDKTLTSVDDLTEYINDIVKDSDNEALASTKVSFKRISLDKSYDRKVYILNAYAYEEEPPDIGHWVVAITEGMNVLLYTCMGIIPLGLLEHLEDKGYKHILIDLRAHQRVSSKSCGFYCIRYIVEEEWRNAKESIYMSIQPGKYSNPSLVVRNTDIFLKNHQDDDDYEYEYVE